jgi:uracil-DNA glycosylase
MEVPTTEQLRSFLIARLRETSWYSALRMFMQGGEFTKIVDTLLQEFTLGYRLTPKMLHLFRAFELTKMEEVKVVIYTQQLSPFVGAYSGIAYDQSLKARVDNPLRYFSREMEETIPGYVLKTDLSYLSKQGVLLLPSALTTLIDKPDSHLELWHPFMNGLFQTFKYDLPDAVYVLIGEKVHWREESLAKESVVIKAPIPEHQMPMGWESKAFVKINEELVKKGKSPINW